jgi:PAS domain S-box-containing protein
LLEQGQTVKLFDANSTGSPAIRDARLTAINFVSDAINRTVDLGEIADNALHSILAATGLDAGAVYVWAEDEQALRLYAHRGITEAFARQISRVHKGENATVDAVLDGATQVIEDLVLKPQLLSEQIHRAGFRSGVLCPIRTQGYVVGLLALGTLRQQSFDQADVDLIEVITNQIGNAMVHAQLQVDLRASEEQYRSLVENSDDAIYISGPDLRPRYANTAFERIHGFRVEELAALDAFSRIHPDDVAKVREAVSKLMDGQSVHYLEYRFCRKDGQWIDLQCSASVFARDGEQIEEFQFVVREITQIRQRQQQLVRRNVQLSALTTLAAVANSSLRIEEIARNTLRVALESTGMEGGGIHLADADRKRLKLFVHMGIPADLEEEVRDLAWGEGTPGVVAASGQTKLYTDLAAEAPMARPASIRHGFRSLIIAPVKVRGETLGTIGLLSHHQIQSTPEVVETVTAIGNQLGIALANARLYEGQVRENEKLRALLDISGGGSQELELGALLETILQRSATLLLADAAYIVRHDKDEARVVAATGKMRALVGEKFRATEGLSGEVCRLQQGRVFSRADVATHSRSQILRDLNLRSVLVVPLMARGRIMGALALLREAGAVADFTDADLELTVAFANRAAAAIDNAELLEDLSRKNELLELLIEEAHHRIKNNLQMISGLLQLEAGDAPTPGLRTAITRIQAIAQVHHLLSSEMPEKVDTHSLIATIVHMLTGTAPVAGGRPEMQLEVEHLWLDADHAVALALIVNELASNSLMHGRPPEGDRLRVRVQCRRAPNEIVVVVCDNGGGLPAGVDWRTATDQGLNLVNQLAEINLRGTLQIGNREGGLCAELRFPGAPTLTASPAES